MRFYDRSALFASFRFERRSNGCWIVCWKKGKKRKKKSLSLSSFLLERKMDTVVHAKNLISNLSI